MAKQKRTSQRSVHTAEPLDQTLERLVRSDPTEVDAAENAGKFRLVEADDTGHRFLVYATDKGNRTSFPALITQVMRF